MKADDARHGSEAGHEQHIRDNEQPCLACGEAKLTASRRRTKRKTQGFRYTLPAGRAHHRVVDWQQRGASLGDIVRHTGAEESVVHRLIHNGPDANVYARTFLAIMRAPADMPLTTIGTTRRIQALTWMGYSVAAIARESGVHNDTILDARDAPREFVAIKVRTAVAAAYERLHMILPTGVTQQDRAGITRARNLARRNGWLPPLAWTQIDDAIERPTGHGYTAPDRATALRDLAELGVGITEACKRLHLSREALERWCERHSMRDVYRTLLYRETPVDGHRSDEMGAAS